tara:strand:+ start:19 stop:252 length:234 start_codon:yes stop_codon:yes gene_type:complete
MVEKKNKKKKQLKSYAYYTSLITQMSAIIIAGAFAGNHLDEKHQTAQPIYTILLSLGSIFLALYYVLKKINTEHEKN